MHMRKLLLLCAAVLMTLLSWAQRAITGRVIDDKGSPLPNVSVTIKGSSQGTVTGSDGTFSLNIPEKGKVVVFSAVGMTSREVTIGTQSRIDVALGSVDQSLQEVVVVGYGTQRRADVTGSISSIAGNKLKDQPIQSFEQGLSGRATGVNVS